MAVGLRNPEIIPDDQVLAFGTHRDIVGLNRASTLAADTALTGVLIGTPESQAIAANSLILSNITASGDIALYTNKGGNSQMGLWLDGSSGDVAMLAASGASVDWYIAGVKEMDYATGAMAFQQATTVSTTTGDMTLDPTGELVELPANYTYIKVTETATYASSVLPDGLYLQNLSVGDAKQVGIRFLAQATDTTQVLSAINHVAVTSNSGALVLQTEKANVLTEMFRLAAAEVVVNETGGDIDFRVEGVASASLLLVDAAAVTVALGGITIVGTGEGGTTAATGKTLRAPDIVTGGAGNVDGADLTIIAGLGTGIGDVGTIIIRTPRVAATGDNIQTLTTLLTLDANTLLVEGGAALKSDSATEIGIQVANGALTVGSAGSLVAPYASGTPTAFTDGIGGNLNGGLGINYDTGGLVSTLEARSNGAWVSVALAGALFQNHLQFALGSGGLYHPDQLVRGEPWEWKDGIRLDTYLDESRCLRCGQPIEVGQDAVFTVNGATGRGVHAIYSHFACALKARGKQLVAA